MKYQIAATLVKNGGAPVYWQRYSDKKLSKQDCLKMLLKCDKNEFNHYRQNEIKIILERFSCRKVC